MVKFWLKLILMSVSVTKPLYTHYFQGHCYRFVHSSVEWPDALVSFDAYSKTCLKRPLKKETKIGFQDRLSLNTGKKYCRMLHLEHSAIHLTFIKLQIVFKIFVVSIFE